jgi:hypothetical protein
VSIEPDLDLVEYMVIALPDLSEVDLVAEALRQLVRGERIRILDLVAVIRTADGGYVSLEPDSVQGMAALADVEGESGGLLSDADIATACSDLPMGTAAVILVSEDSWAGLLAEAARSLGGQIAGGERIPRYRIAARLAARPPRSA